MTEFEEVKIDDLRDRLDALEKRVADLERRASPKLRVVRATDSPRTTIQAFLGGASERQRHISGLTYRDVCERLRRAQDWAAIFAFNAMLAAAAALPTIERQISVAAALLGQIACRMNGVSLLEKS